MVFCSLIASSAIRAFISALKLRRCLDFISAPFPRQRFYTLLTGPNFGEHLRYPVLGWMPARTLQNAEKCWDKEQRRNRGENQAAYDRPAKRSILFTSVP